MSIYGEGVMAGGGKKPTPLSVSTNGTWSRDGGYSPVSVSVPASAVTSGTKVIIAYGDYDVTEFKNVRVVLGPQASTSPVDGLSYVDGLPNDWNTMKEIAKAISEASGSINANTTGSIYVSNGNTWAYKITPGNTINIASQIGTNAYAVMGFNNFALTNRGNYGGTHTTAGLTFGMVDCVQEYQEYKEYQMNSTNTNSDGWGGCLMRTSTMPTLQNGMPATLAQVRVPYVNNGQSTILYSDDYMFLPAEKEVFGKRTYSPIAEADALTQFAYYKNGGSTIKKRLDYGWETEWWLRSSYYNSGASFCSVKFKGEVSGYYASSSAGAAPCFCV